MNIDIDLKNSLYFKCGKCSYELIISEDQDTIFAEPCTNCMANECIRGYDLGVSNEKV